jgi:hypothetical protein
MTVALKFSRRGDRGLRTKVTIEDLIKVIEE